MVPDLTLKQPFFKALELFSAATIQPCRIPLSHFLQRPIEDFTRYSWCRVKDGPKSQHSLHPLSAVCTSWDMSKLSKLTASLSICYNTQ